jgi:hypothetical protein
MDYFTWSALVSELVKNLQQLDALVALSRNQEAQTLLASQDLEGNFESVVVMVRNLTPDLPR